MTRIPFFAYSIDNKVSTEFQAQRVPAQIAAIAALWELGEGADEILAALQSADEPLVKLLRACHNNRTSGWKQLAEPGGAEVGGKYREKWREFGLTRHKAAVEFIGQFEPALAAAEAKLGIAPPADPM